MNRVTMLFLLFSMCSMIHSLYHPGTYKYEPPMISKLKMRRRILKDKVIWARCDGRVNELSDLVKTAPLDGYTLISAILVGRLDVSWISLSGFSTVNISTVTVPHLMELGFKPTEKDQWYAFLDLYERTLDDSKRKLTLLRLCTNHKLPRLPLEIICHIASFITHNEEPLIPRYLCTACKMIKK